MVFLCSGEYYVLLCMVMQYYNIMFRTHLMPFDGIWILSYLVEGSKNNYSYHRHSIKWLI